MAAGNLGTLDIEEPVKAAMNAQLRAKKAGADFVVCLVHMGMTNMLQGELVDFARNVSGFGEFEKKAELLFVF